MNAQDLKNSILQLAIQGKLVEQREEEGTAKELLKKIAAEKKQLIKEGKIKKQKALPEIKDDEIPFDIPESWEWVRVGDIGSWSAGATPSRSNPKYYGGDIPWLKTGDLNDGYIMEVPEFISEEALEKTSVRLNPVGSVLMAMYGATIGKLGILNIEATTNQACCACIPYSIIYNKYLFYYLMGQRRVYIKMGAGGAQPNISKEKIINSIVPLPPLEEQKRIVAKIEELMPYVDKYDVAYSEVEELNKKFPEDMQKSILQYAIQGKLVEQREQDGTAEDLYKQIQEEKKKLIKEGKIKKTKTLPEITEDEIPFDIPENWKWVRLGDALDIARGGSPRPIKSFITDSEDGVNWIKIGDTDKGGKYINSTNEKIIKEGVKKSRFVKKGDFLLSNSMSFGRPYILNIDGCIHDGWLVLSQRVEVFNKDFLYYLLSSRMVFNQFQSVVSGAVVNNLNSDKVRLTIVAIPPLTEQKRIVEKIEELLPYTNQLVKKVD
jgi:type I restriction enzyme S subunit